MHRSLLIQQLQHQTGNMNVDLKVDEGKKYYFGNITWKGNAKYSDSILNVTPGYQ